MLFLHICLYLLLNVVQYYPVLEETSTEIEYGRYFCQYYYLAFPKLEFQNSKTVMMLCVLLFN